IYFSVVQRKVVSPNDFRDVSDAESRLLDFHPTLRTDRHTVRMEIHQERSERPTRAHRRSRQRRPRTGRLTTARIRHRNSVPDHLANARLLELTPATGGEL